MEFGKQSMVDDSGALGLTTCTKGELSAVFNIHPCCQFFFIVWLELQVN